MTAKNGKATGKITHRFRCAIYTRKSNEDGLEQEFNSLDAQREAGEAFVKSQAHEGWECLPDHYDDGGFTGGNMDRPAVQRLMADIEAGRVDCVVVYKVDRLSRSLLDFARLGHVTRAPLTQIMNLLHLGPDIQEAILFLPRVERGRDPIQERQLRPIAAVPDWRKQRRMWKQLKG